MPQQCPSDDPAFRERGSIKEGLSEIPKFRLTVCHHRHAGPVRHRGDEGAIDIYAGRGDVGVLPS